MNICIRPSQARDLPRIIELNLLAFLTAGEGSLVQALESGGHSRLSLVAEDTNIIGHILFSEIEILQSRNVTKALSLAPMCVIPGRQRLGIGSALVREGILKCRAMGYPGIFVLGYPEFYRKFGFNHEVTKKFECPYSGPAFMALELSTGSLLGKEGKLAYPEPFRSAL